MLQAASRPAAPYSEMQTYNHSTPAPALQIPRKLTRPQFKEVSRNALLAIVPDLPNYPVEFIKHHLASRASEMRRALSLMSIMSSLPRSHLPPFLDVPLMPSGNPPESNDFPTHLLAVSSAKLSPSSPNTPTVASFAAQVSASATTVPLYPTNALVLAAHCTLLPPLSANGSSNETGATMRLPIIPLAVPSAETFPQLHAFLHDKRADKLLATLLPSLASHFPRPSSSSSSRNPHEKPTYASGFSSDHLRKFAQDLAAAAYAEAGPQGATNGLMGHTRAITGVWKNTCALGIYDTELWDVIDLAWEIVLIALNQVAARDRY